MNFYSFLPFTPVSYTHLMENTGVFYPALLLFLAGCAGFYICWEQMKNRGPDYQPKVVWRDDEQTKRVK